MVTIIREFAAAVVPRLADFAAVHLLESLFIDGSPAPVSPEAAASSLVRRVAVVHDDTAGRWRSVVPEGDVQVMHTTSPCYVAMATGEPAYVPRIDAAHARAMARTHTTGDLVPLVADRAFLAVPLRVRGRILGCVALTRRARRVPFDEVDMLTVSQLAAQASLGIDNARLYRGQATTATELQRSMLPASPPTLAGVEVAHRYLPGNPTAEVGGDWFDTIPLPGSRVAIVMGDVMGHGIRSAAVMGHLRTAVQTLTALDLPPGQVLRHLDDLAQRLGDDHLATCLYAVYDPVARRCVFANAGHIPPVIAHPDGTVELVPVPTGAPIGVGGVAFEPHEIKTTDGDVMLLCTDGLVEVRGQSIDEGIVELRESLARPGLSNLSPDALCDILLSGQRRDERADDLALLVARLRGIPASDVAHWLLEPRPTTAAHARRLIRETLGGWGLSAHSDLTELLATELITNAIRYASRPIELRLLRIDNLLCEVSDDDHYLPVLRSASASDERGRGLFLVSQLAQRWGVSRTAGGKVVWFEQALGEQPF